MVSKDVERSWSDLAIPPGELLEEELEAIGMTQTDLAARTGRPIQAINEIVRGRKQITQDTALELEKVLGIPASVWIRLEADYQLTLARQREEERLEEEVEWLNSFPVREMESRGWIPQRQSPKDKARELLRFLGVASFSAWQQTVLGFRVTPRASVSWGPLAVWLRKGEIDGHQLETAIYREQAFRSVLPQIRALTREPAERFQTDLVRLCADGGVAVVFTREFPSSGANGVARWLTPEKALIQLSLRYKTNDHLWFSFFHECCHVLRHKIRDIHIDWMEAGGDDEAEANAFAEDMLIPREAWDEFVDSGGPWSRTQIEMFAESQGIAPGIVVGRLQHLGLLSWRSGLNSLKVRLGWKSEAKGSG